MTRGTGPIAATRYATVLVRGLSGGRRTACRLALNTQRAFHTDLRDVWMPWPLPAGLGDHPQGLTGCLALQASPTKEVVARLSASDVTPRMVSALQLCEAAAAVGWVSEQWPGLLDGLLELTDGIEPGEWDPLTPEVFAERARSVARDHKGERVVPPVLGLLPLKVGGGVLNGLIARIIDALPRLEAALGRLAHVEIISSLGGDEDEGETPQGISLSGDGTWVAGRIDGSFPYPEWDEQVQEYREDYVHVFEERRTGSSTPAGPPRSDLEAWFSAPLDRRWTGRLRQGADIDIDAMLELRTGGTPSDRLYRERVRIERVPARS